MLSHRLIALAPEKIKNTVVEAIYKAYFEDGLDIGNIDILASIGTAGMNHTELRNLLSSDAALNEVMNDAVGARHRGITNVPFFIFNNKIRVDGSHSVEIFLHILNRAALLKVSPALLEL